MLRRKYKTATVKDTDYPNFLDKCDEMSLNGWHQWKQWTKVKGFLWFRREVYFAEYRKGI
jgi:hypothetical protein